MRDLQRSISPSASTIGVEGGPPSLTAGPAPSVVELRRMLMHLERVGIVRKDHVAAFGIEYATDPGISVQDPGRTVSVPDAREQVLVEIFPEIANVAGQHDSTCLRQAHHHQLASRGERDGAMDIHAAIAEQIQIAIDLADLRPGWHILADRSTERGEVAGDVRTCEARRGPERSANLVPMVHDRGIRELTDVAGVIEVEVPEHDIFHVIRLHPGFCEL